MTKAATITEATIRYRPLREGGGSGFEPPWRVERVTGSPWDEVESLRMEGGAWLAQVALPPRGLSTVIVRGGAVSVLAHVATRKVRREAGKKGLDPVTWWETRQSAEELLLSPRMPDEARVLACVAMTRLVLSQIGDASLRERTTAVMDRAWAADGVVPGSDCEAAMSALYDESNDRLDRANEAVAKLRGDDESTQSARERSASAAVDNDVVRAAWFSVRSACHRNSVTMVCYLVGRRLGGDDAWATCLDTARLAIGDRWFLAQPSREGAGA